MRHLTRSLAVASFTGVLALAAQSSHAVIIAGPLTAYTSTGATGGGADGLSLGRQFTVSGTGITIQSEGFFDLNADGLSAAKQLRLFTLSGPGGSQTGVEIPAGAVTVPSGTAGTLIGADSGSGFRAVALPAPLFLAPGNYSLVGYDFTKANDPYGDMPQSSNPRVGTPNGNNVVDTGFDPYQLNYTGTSGYPSSGDGNNHASTSFTFDVGNTTTPEPAGLALVALGVPTLLARRRKA